MRVTKRIAMAASAMALIAGTAACVTDPNTGERRVSRAAIGAGLGLAGGYLAGDLLGGRGDRTEKIVGAGIGAIAGGAVGAYMDRQEQELRRQTEGTGVVIERQGDELILNMPSEVTFATNRFDIQPQFRATLDDVARTLSAYPSTYIDIYGHTDSTGNDGINVPLSNNRARSVADYLSSRGVNDARIETRGFGSSQPVASNDTADGRQQNRRVEIRVVPVENTGGY